jgi:hydrogenase maturation protease
VTGRTLVAGIGNLFLGDDGFGCEVVRCLAARPLPAGVKVVDFGIRGFDLAFALGEGYESAILVDAVRRGGAPGTLYVLDPGSFRVSVNPTAHTVGPDSAMQLARTMGGLPERIRVVGCEPAWIPEDDDLHLGLSQPVAAAVEEAAALVEEILNAQQD